MTLSRVWSSGPERVLGWVFSGVLLSFSPPVEGGVRVKGLTSA